MVTKNRVPTSKEAAGALRIARFSPMPNPKSESYRKKIAKMAAEAVISNPSSDSSVPTGMSLLQPVKRKQRSPVAMKTTPKPKKRQTKKK